MIREEISMCDGFSFFTEARSIRPDVYAAVMHVITDASGGRLSPAVVIIAPGHFLNEDDAHRSACEYARLMAKNGALQIAVAVRNERYAAMA